MKNRLLLPFLLPILFLTTLYADITTGLVAHYEFEGNANDSAGWDNNATDTNVTYVSGRYGQAGSFDGISSKVVINSLSGFPDTSTAQPYTLSAWVKPNNLSNDFSIIGWTEAWTTDYKTNALSLLTGTGIISYWYGAATDFNVTTSDLSGAWHHVVTTWDGTNRTIWLDGVLLGTNSSTGLTATLVDNQGFIGVDGGGSGRYANGLIDDARIYNRALTATDVVELYNPKLLLKAHGGAVEFPQGRDNYINLPTMTFAGNITSEAWVKHKAGTDYTRILEITDGTNIKFHVSMNPSSQIFAGDGTNNILYSIPSNTWIHTAVTMETNGSTTLYIDGALAGTITGTPISGTFSVNSIHRGNIVTSSLEDSISMDEVRIWDTVRTQTEIISSMNYQLEGNETGLVAYYNFDERAGNKVVDIAGGDLNATIEGNVTRLNFLGDGLSFDGSTSYVSVLASTPINMSGSSSLTVSAWIQTTATTGFIYEKLTPNTTGEFNYLFKLDGTGKVKFETNIEGATWVNPNTSTIAVNDGLWHYVTVIKDGITNKIYIDGVLNNTVTNDVSTATTSTAPITIGRVTREAVKEYFTGNISNVSIWNKALTQNDINRTMHSSLSGNESGLVGYWPLNEGTGLTAYDRSINANNGIITGTTWIDTAPKILGDKLYVRGGLITHNKLIVENNITTPTYAWDGAVPASIDFNSTMGAFTHTATDFNESFGISANNEYNVTVRTINYPEVAFVYLNLNLSNVLLTDHNITNIQVIGEDGNTENFNIPDVVNIVNGTNSYSVPVYNPDNNFSIRVDVNDTDFYQSYYYNFVDKRLYGSQDYNLSSDFKQEISLVNSSFTIDANLSNYIADLDFHVDFSGSTTSLAYSTLQGFISDNTNQFIENLPLQTATSIGTLAYDFNTTVKQYHKEQSVAVRLESLIANNSLLITPLLNENNASHNIGPTVIAANLVDINISINEIGPISNILIYNLNGNLKSYALLKEEFNTSAVSFTLPVVSGDYSVQAIYRDGNISSYDNVTNQWIDGSSTKPVFTIGASLTLPIVDSNFTAVLVATTFPTALINNQDIYLVRNFEDLNLTFSAYDTFGSDINISVEYNSSILEINSSFNPFTYITQADYSSSYLILKSIADVTGVTPVKITFANTNLLSTFTEFNITVAPYGTKVITGWNLLSLPVSIDLNATDLKDTFSHDPNIERLYKYNGRWNYWDSIAGYDINKSMSKFSSLRSTEGFWLKATADTDVIYNFEGNVTDINSSLNVYHSGWHLMGFNEDHNITDIPTIVSDNNITGIDSVDYVYRYEYINRTAHWEVHTPDVNLSASIDSTIEHTEDNVSRYDGVWVYVRKVY